MHHQGPFVVQAANEQSDCRVPRAAEDRHSNKHKKRSESEREEEKREEEVESVCGIWR